MCGFAGFTKTIARNIDPGVCIQSMTSLLGHRGPDASSFFSDDHIELGHTRLSIIDLDAGKQPMASGDGRYHIVCNGEIYNYIELRAQLESRGVCFRTRSDTEALLYQYIVHGLAGLSDLNGMFAFAIWDCLERTLFIARDRMGIKPFHYARINDDLIFGSEIKSVLQHPAVKPDVNVSAVSKYLSYGNVPAPDTIYRDIRKLEPGHYLVWKNGSVECGCYWDIPLSDHSLCGDRINESMDKVVALLDDSVTKRFRADVPVGVFLSGGLDSSLITALAARSQPGGLASFSLGFEESSYDESGYAEEVARFCGTKHHHTILTAQAAAASVPRILDRLDEPFGDASIVPTYCLSQFASGHVKTVMGGDGADELFAGYPAFAAHKVMERLSVLPPSWRDRLIAAAKHIPVTSSYASAGYLLDQFFKGTGIAPDIRFMIWMGIFGNEQKSRLLHADLKEHCLRDNPFEDVVKYVRQSGLSDGIARLIYISSKMYLQDGVLVKVDRASMANSLEVRVPYLDHNLVEYVSGMPSRYKLKGLTTKYLLKKIAADYLPQRIINRRKSGFMMPLADWIRGDLRDLIFDVCGPDMIRSAGMFNPDEVGRMLHDHDCGKRDYRKMIWALFTFQYWYHHVRANAGCHDPMRAGLKSVSPF